MKSSNISDLLYFTARSLTEISDSPYLDAERLMLHVLGQKESAWLYAHGEENLTSEQRAEFEKAVAERAMGKPLAYILGEWEFYGRPFFVNKDVLVPRPETENLVKAALGYSLSFLPRNKVRGKLQQKSKAFTIADIGTGSGVIVITLALELITRYPLHITRYSFIATDISPAVLEVARRNAVRHGVLHLIDFRLGNMLEPLKGEKVDLIVSNPPYLPTEELASPEPRRVQGKIETTGLDFEPRLALDGGPDGLAFVREIKKAARTLGIPAVIEMTQGKVSMLA